VIRPQLIKTGFLCKSRDPIRLNRGITVLFDADGNFC